MEELETDLNEGFLTISAFPDKGRCLFATKHFYPGEVILREKPYVSVPNNKSRCDGCFGTSSLKKCSVCQIVWYCSTSCQVCIYIYIYINMFILAVYGFCCYDYSLV
ncbi:hypothetical protein G4B88_005120 [Cannabis sativa]|uniref:MYND-type domain-containing protein n=1 Tax=Cannabis sativa TaxID=3483 RepID=A0A7J6EUH5_CANSA|nr:hypothetical protein G4B88_005120 [Cannabis sativa]